MSNRRSTRRDFLRGRAAAGALAAPDAAATPTLASPAAERPACTLSLSRRAMACEFQVQLATRKNQNESSEGIAALDLIDELEDLLSVYRSHSTISKLNRAAQQAAAPVDAALLPVMSLCEDLYLATDGAFDATTGPLSRAWGFFHRQGRVPTDQQLADARRLTGWRHVQFNPKEQTLRLPRPGMEVNFNGVGKGYALDQATALLAGLGVEHFLLHGGRSTLVARGNRPDGPAGWGIAVRHPLRPQRTLAEFHLQDAAFSTSGSATQGFTHNGRRYGHVLDPRTGLPGEGVLSTSVVAPSGAVADALSTALFVMGPAAAREFCQQHPQVSALFVLPGETASKVCVEAINLPDELWRPVQAE